MVEYSEGQHEILLNGGVPASFGFCDALAANEVYDLRRRGLLMAVEVPSEDARIGPLVRYDLTDTGRAEQARLRKADLEAVGVYEIETA